MSRTVNDKRPEELRREIMRYLIKHGLSDLSLRPLAKAVGSSPRVLLYYFGSKEKMVVEVIGDIRREQFKSYGGIDAPTFEEACVETWKIMSTPDSTAIFRLFFEAYGIALRRPKLYKQFLHDTVEDWVRLVADPLRQEGYELEDARAIATIMLAGLRGFMLDFCNTGDRRRLDRAVRTWGRSLDAGQAERKRR